MSYDEALKGAGGQSGVPVELRAATGGAPLDDGAFAHEVELSGFKLDTQAKLTEGLMVAFVLELMDGGRVTGEGRVMWSRVEDFGCWAGIKIVRMSWIDKRRMSRALSPGLFDWARIADLAMKAMVALTVIAATNKLLFHRPHLLALMGRLLPQAIALMLMGWALLGLLRRDKR